jgi:perosamine synthetase
MKEIKKHGVDSRTYFYPVSDMPMFSKTDTPVAHQVYAKGINLPTYFDLAESDIRYICNVLKNYLS